MSRMKASVEEDLKASLLEQKKNMSQVQRLHGKDNIYIRLIHTKYIIFAYFNFREFSEVGGTKEREV